MGAGGGEGEEKGDIFQVELLYFKGFFFLSLLL